MRFKPAAFDILAGFVALCSLFVSVIVFSQNDLQLFCAIVSVLYFLAGVLRGGTPQNPLLKTLLIAFGGAAPVVAMRVTRVALTAHGYVLAFLFFSFVLTAAGVGTRRFLIRRRFVSASLLTASAFAVAAVAIVLAIPPLLSRSSIHPANRSVPSFSFVGPDGKTMTSASLHGHVVVLAFWATWCVPCREELPALGKVLERYKGDSEVRFYAVGGPWGGDTFEKEASFAKQMALTLPLAYDSHRRTETVLRITVFPSLVVLDGAGNVRMVHAGYDASERLAQEVAKEIDDLTAGRG